uniref:Crystaline entomocidal protoxin n=1 Tax=Bacillus thuringiensis TaxID=1428 RepID=A0A7G0XQI6_BACTU|nr:insecticidal crystal protein [Bacillus thuringiensis]
MGGLLMNQNYNNNEYQVIDNGGRGYQPRYPLAQAPGSEFPQMNYKDWMDRYTGEEQAGGLIRAEIDANTALTATFGVAWAVLGVSNPVGSAVAGILNVVTPIIFNQVDPNSPLKVWESMIGYAQALIKKELTETVRNLALDHIDRINDYQIDYKNKAKIWETNPTPGNTSQLLDAFRNLKRSCQDAMPHLDTRGYETILLPLYAQAANIHLIVLRDGLMHGRSWGMTNEEYEDLYSGFFGFTNRIATYTNYCTNTFNQGTTMNYVADMEDCTKYPWIRYNQDEFYNGFFGPENSCKQAPLTNEYTQSQNGFNQPFAGNARYSTGEYKDVEAWNLRNEFISSMTIQVLDTVALWPTYDPKVYTAAVKTEFTREIYTSIRGTTYRSDPAQNTMSAIDARMIRPPHLFEWPQTMTFFFENVNVRYTWVGNSWTKGQALIGLKTESTRTLDTNIITALQGVTDEGYYIPLDVSTRQKDITRIRTKQWFEPREFGFYRSGDELALALGTIQEDLPGYSVYLVNDYIYTPSIRQNTFPPIEVPEGTPPPSHRLSWFKFEPVRYNGSAVAFVDPKQIGATIFGWTHTSVDPNNTIDATKITQIPAVKAFMTEGIVIKGPGSTGGDLVKLSRGNVLHVDVNMPADPLGNLAGFRIRIRYAASSQPVRLGVNFDSMYGGGVQAYTLPATYSGGDLTYGTFKYQETLLIRSRPQAYRGTVVLNNLGSTVGGDEVIIIDKIEFIPIQGSLEVYEAEQNLEKARKAVNALFTSDAKNALQLNITDYAVDQAANLVECVSDEICPQEKMILLDQVKFAKRLSQARNLLNYGDFESPDWSGENGWKTSNHVHVAADNPIFKGRYLHMPGATDSQFSDTVYPTYMYQKVDESKLQPYTRYLVRGFVGNSKDLELFVERYGKDVHVEMDVPNDIRYTMPTNTCGGFDRCGQQPYQITLTHTCTCKDPSQMNPMGKRPHKSCGCKDPHVFSYHIDTGSLDLTENLGLWFALKVASPDGVANIDNLEIIEAQPLTGEALARVKKREHKWKEEMAQRRLQTEKAVQAAQVVIRSLFTSPQQDRLKFNTVFSNILNADVLVQKIPYGYHSFLNGALPAVPGMNFEIVQQFSSLIGIAGGLYSLRNLMRNGTFSSGAASWHVTDGVKVQPEGNTSVLVISNWDDKGFQNVRIDPDRGYVLRVTARKEGAGEGYVVMSDCDNGIEKLTFTSCDSEGTSTQTMMADTGSMPCKNAKWGEEITSAPMMPMGYVTKTAEFYPDTDRIRIEIGETEGTFKVESVELICMELMDDPLYDVTGNMEGGMAY